jgi:hypothetical protein
MYRPLLLLPFLLAACGSSPDVNREPAPDAEQREQELREAEAKRRQFENVMVRLDQAIDSYVRLLANHGETRADQQAERIEKSIRDMVLDRGPVVVGSKEPPPPVGENFHRIQAAAADGSNTHQQAIALTALGFAERNELMPLILQGAQLSDPFLVDHAVLGLAILQAPDTPPGVLASIVWRADHPEDGRAQAAWALYRIQEVTENQEPIIAIWKQFLTDGRSKLPAGALVCAVRGLGLTRDKQYADLVAPYLTHPVARLRMVAAIAIARMNAQQYAAKLIDLLGPQESVQNVRLHARKALSDLAGGRDYGYDVPAWRKVFDRGQ